MLFLPDSVGVCDADEEHQPQPYGEYAVGDVVVVAECCGGGGECRYARKREVHEGDVAGFAHAVVVVPDPS